VPRTTPRSRSSARRALAALTATAALTAPLLTTTPAQAAGPGYTVKSLTFTLPVDGGSESRCVVDADLYQPAGVDHAHPAPAILTTNGFGGSKADGQTDAIAKAFAARGYVALAYSGLGFGKSGCRISLDDPRIDGEAASGLVSFLGGTKAADDGTKVDFVTLDKPGDPRVGMIGGSYGGAVQLAAASVDPRIDAIVPLITWNDLSYSLDPNNTDLAGGVTSRTPGVYKTQWTNGFFLIGQLDGLVNYATDPSRVSVGCVNFTQAACDTKSLLDSGRYPAARTAADLAYARSVSPVSYLSKVRTPTLLVQGEDDTLFNLNEAAATYRTLHAQGTPVKMIWQSWGHSGGMSDPAPGELNLSTGNLESSYVGQRILAWFGHYLRRQPVDTGPQFAYYRDWVGDPDPGTGADPAYATSGSYPVGSTQPLYLSGDGSLVTSDSAVERGAQQYGNWPLVPTSHSESSLAGFLGLPDPAPYDTPGTYVSYTSAPLTGDVDVAGTPKATLSVVSPAADRSQSTADASGDLVVFAKLYDVAPDGTETLVNRLVAPARVPDATLPFTVTLPGIVHRYAAGHRLRFVVAASDDAYYGNQGVKPVILTSAPGATGVLDLPVVGGHVG
jgi:putative CocE/NonD family hydrolase